MVGETPFLREPARDEDANHPVQVMPLKVGHFLLVLVLGCRYPLEPLPPLLLVAHLLERGRVGSLRAEVGVAVGLKKKRNRPRRRKGDTVVNRVKGAACPKNKLCSMLPPTAAAATTCRR